MLRSQSLEVFIGFWGFTNESNHARRDYNPFTAARAQVGLQLVVFDSELEDVNPASVAGVGDYSFSAQAKSFVEMRPDSRERHSRFDC